MEQHDLQAAPLYNRGLLEALLGDGRPCLTFTGLSLALAGGFAIFLALTGQFLPHDIAFLGMDAAELCALHLCRIVSFMIHDRAAFGGALLAIGVLYIWLAEFPLRHGEAWAWWAFLISGLAGFGSFLAYLGYGYLDTWHGLGTLLLLPLFVTGLVRSYPGLPEPRGLRSIRAPGAAASWGTAFGLGRLGLISVAAGMITAGLTILTVGTGVVFVPQDLVFMGLSPADLQAINPRLIPLIAHDRAGFGGAILTTGLLAMLIAWCARPAPSLWQALAAAGTIGFGAAIGIHLFVGYVDFVHLAPAVLGAGVYAGAMALIRRRMYARA